MARYREVGHRTQPHWAGGTQRRWLLRSDDLEDYVLVSFVPHLPGVGAEAMAFACDDTGVPTDLAEIACVRGVADWREAFRLILAELEGDGADEQD